MRILQVRFKNLNSLWGEWQIDFTAPAFADGIFAITGPTGAGKTTILDAICLALYGRTPRLKDITQSGNEIMSRQAGECFSEVMLEAGGGRYSIFWGQHRAHKRQDGALQMIRHELFDAGSKRMIENRRSEVAVQIAAITGLTFDQFVRSMMLAQGNFATFLQSNAGERSPILEKITGTEIYSQISIRTHEIRAREQRRLKELTVAAEGVPALTQAQQQSLTAELSSLTAKEKTVEEQLKERRAELERMERMTALEAELAELEQQWTELTKREKEFSPERGRLERAQQALELGGDRAALVSLRREQDSERATLLSVQAAMPEQEADLRRAEDEMQLAIGAFTAAQLDQRRLTDLLVKVRALDLREREKNGPFESARAELTALEDATAALEKKSLGDRDALEKRRIIMRDAQGFLQSHASDERLFEQLAAISASFERLEAAFARRVETVQSLKAADDKAAGLQNVWKEQSASFEALKVKIASVETDMRNVKGLESERLKGRTLVDLREDAEAATARMARLVKVRDLLDTLAKTGSELSGAETAVRAIDAEARALRTRKEKQEAAIHDLERETAHLEKELLLLQRVIDLEDERARLHDGEPCPLCGSTVHPFADGHIPELDENSRALDESREQLKKEEAVRSEILVEEARQAQERQGLLAAKEKAVLESATLKTRVDALLSELSLTLPLDLTPVAGIGQIIQRHDENMQAKRLLIDEIQRFEDKLTAARDELESLRAQQSSAAQMQQEGQAELNSVRAEREGFAHDMAMIDDDIKNLKRELGVYLLPYGFRNIPDDNPSQLMEELTARANKWKEQRDLCVTAEKDVAAAERDLHHESEAIEKQRREIKEKTAFCRKLSEEREELRQQRYALFEAQDPDAAAEEMEMAVAAAQIRSDEKRAARDKVKNRLDAAQARMAELEKGIRARADLLQKHEVAFSRRLLENGFQNEDLYVAACLDEAERKHLQGTAQELSNEHAKLEGMRIDKKFAVDELRRVAPVSDPEALRGETAGYEKELKELRLAIGGLQGQLQSDEASARLQDERLRAVEQQKKECLKWDRLHELIGSADGQKYRNFAQGLTFDMLIRHANRQLEKMTDRYLLARDESAPLELKIVDNYQAGEMRSTKNLSGGETFIVSLALALGLSRIASQNVRVDSLFLDEGFGTLDEDALDLALSALASLRGEGKIIGVISHVDALKERIPTQIEVVPQGAGRSIIKLPELR